jgi:CBS domain containing-hemolysin-like protein
VRENPDGSYSMGGGTPIEEANKALGTGFSSDDFGTVGGLVFGRLGRAPKAEDEVSIDGYLLRVQEVDGSRVARVVARKEAS